MTARKIEIEVDGLPVKVWASQHKTDPEKVENEVRTKRKEAVGSLDQHEPAPDYDAYLAKHGEPS